MISTYLVHHGYCATAEAFAHSTGQVFHEELASIKNRQRKHIYYEANFNVFFNNNPIFWVSLQEFLN